MTSQIVELYGRPTDTRAREARVAARAERCPFLDERCDKIRKSAPEKTIGTCSLWFGGEPVIICPHRFLADDTVFREAAKLLGDGTREAVVLPEVSDPSGNVDYVLARKQRGAIVDFVGVELQSLDTTGSIWPARGRFLYGSGDAARFGINWKMTAKTILMQLRHKLALYESMRKKLVLVIQDCLWRYLQEEFDTSGVTVGARASHAFHLHVYTLTRAERESEWSLTLKVHGSGDSSCVERMLAAATGRALTSVGDYVDRLGVREREAARATIRV